MEDSLNKLLEEPKSLCRYGDAELSVLLGTDLSYQTYDKNLADRLKEILYNKNDNCYVGIPREIQYFEYLKKGAKRFWVYCFLFRMRRLANYFNYDSIYLDSCMTRIYMPVESSFPTKQCFDKFKKIFRDKDILIVEGEHTRFGVNNDLLASSKSLKRIICPDKNAWSYYEKILSTTLQYGKDKLIIICLGPTATILANDLSCKGLYAMDLGNLDIEYEWYMRKDKNISAIEGKTTNEACDDKKEVDITDSTYKEQIVVRV